MTERVYASLEADFPWVIRELVEYKMTDKFEVIVKLKGGDTYSYNCIDRILHRLPDDSDHLSESECRSEFGRNLNKLMAQRKMIQADLSRLTGIPQCQISNYIRGKTSPSFYNADKIAKALDCSMDELRYTGL